MTPSFWRDIQPCAHLLQIYDDDHELLLTLERFVSHGLQNNGAVILIATPRHLHEVEQRVRRYVELDRARWQGRYVPLLAEQTLARFMVDGWPDAERFFAAMSEVVVRARSNAKDVRAFGEMVGLLMARGEREATVRLEQLWTEFCRRDGLPLLCAYPRHVFGRGTEATHRAVCEEHSTLLAA